MEENQGTAIKARNSKEVGGEDTPGMIGGYLLPGGKGCADDILITGREWQLSCTKSWGRYLCIIYVRTFAPFFLVGLESERRRGIGRGQSGTVEFVSLVRARFAYVAWECGWKGWRRRRVGLIRGRKY